MAIVFPASPSINETFTEGSITYKCVGTNPIKWIGLGITPADRLVEGSNSLEITAGNDLVWTGDSVLLGTSTSNSSDRLTVLDPGSAFMSIRSDVASDGNSQVLDFGVGTADRSSANLTAVIAADIHSTSGGTLKADLVFQTNAGNNISDKMRLTSDGDLGIGQADPQGDLHIGNISGSKNLIMHAANNGDALIRFREGGSTASGFNEYSIGMDGGRNSLVVNGQGAGEIIAVKGDTGHVGINETTPNRNLYISGDEDTAYSLTSGSNNAYLRLHNKDGTDSTGVGSHVGIEMYVGSGATSVGMLQMIRTGDNIGDLSYKTRTGSSSYRERLRVRNNGDVILGPYDPVGSYTDSSLNVPYEIKVAPFGWQNNTEIAGISMGNHSGSTGNDEGEIVFKTTLNAHQGTTGLVERARINNNGSFTVSTYGGLEANGNPDNFALWQCSGGRITMASSGAWQRMFHCGHTCNATLRLYVTSGNAVNGGGHMFEYKICVVYGAASISQTATYVYGTTQGNIQAVAVQYNNSGYQLEAQVSWTQFTSLPVVNWVLEGQSSSSWSP
jgi:hypothetical protein